MMEQFDQLAPQELEKPVIFGFIGGMGRETSKQFIMNLILEHPELNGRIRYIDVHSRINPILEQEYVKQGLHREIFEKIVVEAALKLAERGATDISLLCNTATQHAPAIRQALEPLGVNFTSIVDAVTAKVQAENLHKILILATPNTTFDLGLYDSLPNLVKPSTDDQELVTGIISSVLQAEFVSENRIEALADMAIGYETDGILFGCTDLAIVMNQFQKQLSIRNGQKVVIESTQALAAQVVSSMS